MLDATCHLHTRHCKTWCICCCVYEARSMMEHNQAFPRWSRTDWPFEHMTLYGPGTKDFGRGFGRIINQLDSIEIDSIDTLVSASILVVFALIWVVHVSVQADNFFTVESFIEWIRFPIYRSDIAPKFNIIPQRTVMCWITMVRKRISTRRNRSCFQVVVAWFPFDEPAKPVVKLFPFSILLLCCLSISKPILPNRNEEESSTLVLIHWFWSLMTIILFRGLYW